VKTRVTDVLSVPQHVHLYTSMTSLPSGAERKYVVPYFILICHHGANKRKISKELCFFRNLCRDGNCDCSHRASKNHATTLSVTVLKFAASLYLFFFFCHHRD